MSEVGARRLILRAALAAAMVTLVALLWAASARAATANLGSLFSSTYTSGFTAGAQTITHEALPPPMIAASPVDGTLISWRFGGGGPFTPRVIRPVGDGSYTGAGTGPLQSGPPGPTLNGPFPLSLPIRRGDLFGVDTMAGSGLRFFSTPAVVRRVWSPPLADGASRPPSLTVNSELAIGAVVRYCIVPELRGKKPFEAAPALAAADCTAGTATKAKKRRKRKRIISQSVAPGTSISDTAPVDYIFSGKKKRKKKKR